MTPNAEITVQVQRADGATNVEGLANGATFTAKRVGTSNEVQLLDANGNVVDIGGAGTGEQKNITGITLAKVTTTKQDVIEQQKQADLKRIRQTFSAFNSQIETVKSFLADNTKQGGALQNDSGARQLLSELNRATQQLNGIDVDKFVQGAGANFAQFERIGRTTAQSVANVASRFGGAGSVLGQALSGLQGQTKGISSQLENLANIEEENRRQLEGAVADITKAVLAVGSQKAFLQKVGNEPTGTPRQAASIFFNLPKLPGNSPATIGVGTGAAV
ncbi:MAG: hypothetical protein HYY23_18135 [Verrucomicrobia bacterium]|nr:hypothetical protein [Verrucomicrobiota bacterium]